MTAIAVDANGADLGPAEVAAGARLAAAQGVECVLFGPVAQIGESSDGVEVVDAPLSIAKDRDPVGAVRSNPEASIVQAARAVADGRAEALVCNGSTGVALAAGVVHVRRAPGIHRPALALTLPVPGRPVTLLDVGANADVRPEILVQFAFMGAAYATAVLGVERPRVGLLSNGIEAQRGSQLVLDTHARLVEACDGSDALRFVGNVEGNGITQGVADVVVCDGFTGNVALKTAEGALKLIFDLLRQVFTATWAGKAAYVLVRPGLMRLREWLDPRRYNGAVMLGLSGVVVKSHGGADAETFAHAVDVAVDMVTHHFNDQIREQLARMVAASGDIAARATDGGPRLAAAS